jgi:hypothetical protein
MNELARPESNGERQRLHPATKTLLALRIAVNREMEELGQFLSRTVQDDSMEPKASVQNVRQNELHGACTITRAYYRPTITITTRLRTISPALAERGPRARSSLRRLPSNEPASNNAGN